MFNRIWDSLGEWKYPTSLIAVVAIPVTVIIYVADANEEPKVEPESTRVTFGVYKFQTELLNGEKVTCFTFHERGISCLKEGK